MQEAGITSLWRKKKDRHHDKKTVDEFPPHARDFSHELGGRFFAFPRKT